MKYCAGLICLLIINCTINNVSAKSFKCSNITDGFVYGAGVDTDRQCIVYVRLETEIEHGCCNGYASNCYAQAEACGYSVGSVPKLNSIMVMGAWGTVNTGHDAIVIELDPDDESRVKVRDSNWDLDEHTKEHWIDTDAEDEDGNLIYGTFGYVYCEKNNSDSSGESQGQIPYTGVSEGNTSIYWTPTDVSCVNASAWYYNGTSTAYENGICWNAYEELKSVNWSKYILSDWYDTFFGNQQEFLSTQNCSAN